MQRIQSQLFGQLSCAHRVRQILLVGKHQHYRIAQLVLVQHIVELPFCLNHTLAIVRVDDEDESLRVLEVVAPQWTDFVLTADIPHGEADVFVLYSLDVESDGWNGGDDLSELQLVENCSFTSRIETDCE
jgi:hypothetical protein